MKYVINIDEDNPIHADDRETVYMDKDTGMTWTISNNGKKKMIPLERIENDMSDLIDRQAAIEAVSYSDVAYYPGDSPSESDCLRKDSVVKQAIMDVPSAQPELIHCWECIYYDPEHIEKNGVRYEYEDMPKDAFDILGTGLVNSEYGINVGGRCCRDYNVGYSEDKRVFVSKQNYCGRAERRTDG